MINNVNFFQKTQIFNHNLTKIKKSRSDQLTFGKREMPEENIIGLSNRALNFDIGRYKRTGDQGVQYSNGGLVTAMKGAGLDVWVAWDGLPLVKNQKTTLPASDKTQIKHIKFDTHYHDNFYGKISNGVIWPLFHMTEPKFSEQENLGRFLLMPENEETFNKEWEDYRSANKDFARSALESLKPGEDNILWVQDYHLMLTPGFLREGLKEKTNVKAKIAYFHHIPFPDKGVLKDTFGEEKTREVVKGLLSCDLIGFHVPSYVNNFMDTVEAVNLPEVSGIDRENNIITYRESGGKQRRIKVKDFPISIDFQAENRLAAKPEVKEEMKDIQEELKDNNPDHKYLVFNIERADFTKNLVRRAKAIGQFLEKTSQNDHKQFTFVIAAPPSRMDVESYADNYKELKKEIGHINNQYEQKEGYSPIIFRENGVSGNEKLAMFRLADALVVNPIADGMNLVAKEIAAYKQPGDRPFKLVMSKTPGIAQDPVFRDNSVLIDDVLSVSDTASAMGKAFRIIKENRENVESGQEDKLLQENLEIQQSVKENNVKKWSDDIMEELNKAGKPNEDLRSQAVTS